MKEVWKNIDDYHQVSNLGRIKSLKREWINGLGIVRYSEEKILKQRVHLTGYMYITLCGKVCKMHRLIAEAFIPNPLGLPQVNHIDGIKTNNVVYNLEWCDNSHNQKHAIRLGLKNGMKGEAHPKHKLTEEEVYEIRNLKHKIYQTEVAKKYNIAVITVSRIQNNKNWTHI